MRRCTASGVRGMEGTRFAVLRGSRVAVGLLWCVLLASCSCSSGCSGSQSGPLAFSPSSLDFGAQTVGQPSAPKTVSVRNVTSTSLSISGIAATGDYAVSAACGNSLSPGSSCPVAVTFTPQALGTRPGSLSVTGEGSWSPRTNGAAKDAAALRSSSASRRANAAADAAACASTAWATSESRSAP